MIFNSPVYPICPSFNEDESLDLYSVSKYLDFLHSSGVKTVMTTAGTSQFNLLSVSEVRELNKTVSYYSGNKILGLPSLSLIHLKEEIKHLNSLELDNTYLLILFPERYYNDEQIYDFFKDICELSEYKILVHGNILRKGYGGSYEYSKPLLEKLKSVDGFIGMKEESSTLMHSIKNIPSGLEIIVAGGSMRRFWSLEPHGATTYLSGVGSFSPMHEESFYKYYFSNPEKAKKIMTNLETPLFDTFMTIGWHASMRNALKEMGFILHDRKPFYQISNEEKQKIKTELEKIL